MSRPSNRRQLRLLEVAIGTATWGLITAPLWAAALIPELWLYLFAAFSLYWLYRSSSVAVFAVVAYRRLRAAQERDWVGAYRHLERRGQVHHLVVYPSHREPVEVLEESLRYLAVQDFPRSQVSVLLALEERDPEARDKARRLLTGFRGQFADLWVTFHPASTGESGGKAANLAYALPRGRQWLAERAGKDSERVLVTVCDADARLHPKYLSALSSTFLATSHSGVSLFQPALLLQANLERIPLYLHPVNGVYTVIQLSRLAAGYKLVTQSVYSLPLKACHEVGYWDPEVMPEDSHMFFKVFFRWGDKARVQPIYLPVLLDAAEGPSVWRTLVNHYRQARRWSWGVSDVPHLLTRALTSPHVPLLARLARVGYYTKEHLFWPSHWFLLSGGLNFMPHLAPDVANSPAARELALLASAAFAASTPLLLVLMWVNRRLRAETSRPFVSRRFWLELLAWLLLPLMSLGLMVLPAVEAHTRLLLGRRLRYDVTEKVAVSQRQPPAVQPVGPVPMREWSG